MKRNILVVIVIVFIGVQVNAQKNKKNQTIIDRTYWANLAYQISMPVLSNMSKGELVSSARVCRSPAGFI